MAEAKTEGVILRGVDFSETSRILTLYTRDFGKMGVMAKGGRRLKSRFEVSLDVLNVCSISAIRKPSAELDLLTEAMLVERFAGFRQNLGALYAGYYVAEVLDGLTQRDEPHPALYQATVAGLRTLAAGADRLVATCKWILFCVADLGYAPQVDRCVDCQLELESGIRPGFSLRAGGVVCGNCASGWPDVRKIHGETVLAMRQLLTPDLLAPELLPLNKPARTELWNICSANVEHLLQRRPKTTQWLDMR